MRRPLLCVLSVMLVSATVAADKAEHKLMKGRLSFAAPSDWIEGPPQTTAISDGAQFVVPKPAPVRTGSSASVVVIANWALSARDIPRYSDGVLKSSSVPGVEKVSDVTAPTGERSVMSRGQVGDTPFLVIDLFGFQGGAHIWCHAAYPLMKDQQAWPEAMTQAWNALVASVSVDGKPVFPKPKEAK